MNKNIGYMICEASTSPKESVIIGEKNNKIIIETILQDLNIKNRNGRIYSFEEMMPELQSDRMKELISSGNMLGEAGHPMKKDITRQQTIKPTNTSHKILKIWVDGNDIKAYVKGTPNKIGEEFNNFILDGTKPSFSLRALGTIKNTHKGAEIKNIRIITWDWVIYPSHKRAYMQKVANIKNSGTLSESNNLILNENNNGMIVPITNENIIKSIKNESANVNSILESINVLYDDISLLENGRQVQLTDKIGNVYIVNLESYIQNKIMNYCYDRF